MPWIKTGEGREVFITDADLKKRQACARQKAAKRSQLGVALMGRQPSTYPYASDAAGVDPSQIPEQMAHDTEHGVPTEYTRTGEPIMRDAAHRRDYMRANGLFDRNAGYSDPEPVNR